MAIEVEKHSVLYGEQPVQPLQIVSTIVIVKSGDRFLLVRRAEDDDIFPGKWQNPGGKVELGERLEETSRRELQEETAIEVDGPSKLPGDLKLAGEGYLGK